MMHHFIAAFHSANNDNYGIGIPLKTINES